MKRAPCTRSCSGFVVQPGEVVALRYRGLKNSESNPGHTYHDIRLVRVDDEDEPTFPASITKRCNAARMSPHCRRRRRPRRAGLTDDIPF